MLGTAAQDEPQRALLRGSEALPRLADMALQVQAHVTVQARMHDDVPQRQITGDLILSKVASGLARLDFKNSGALGVKLAASFTVFSPFSLQ